MLWWMALVFAGPFDTIPVQGALTDAAGAPLSGARAVTIRTWEAATGGLALTEQTVTATFVNGQFAVRIDAPTLPTASPAWLSVQLVGDLESERVSVGASPFALRARLADDATKLGGAPAESYVQWASGYLAGAGLSLNGRTFSATPYTAGAGLALNGQAFSVDANTVVTWGAGYLPGTGLSLAGRTFAVDGTWLDGQVRSVAASTTTPLALAAGTTVGGQPVLAGTQVGYGLPNLLTNGGFDLFQRGTSAQPDLWTASGTVTWLRTSDTNRPTVARATAVGGAFLFQKLENPTDFAGVPVTLSIDVKSAGGGTVRVDDGVGGTQVAIPNTAGAWQRLTVRHTVAAAPTRLGVQITPGTNSVDLDAAMLSTGSWTNAAYTPVPPADDLVRAMRYYEADVGTLYSDDGNENAGQAWRFPFKVAKSGTPTMTWGFVAGASGQAETSRFVGGSAVGNTLGFDFDIENEDAEARGASYAYYKLVISWTASVAQTW